MRILQAGYPKSGNYWLYRMLSEIKTAAGVKPVSYIKNDPIYPLAKKWELTCKDQVDIDTIDISKEGCFYRINARYRNRIENFEEYVGKTNHVWTNSDVCSGSQEVFKHFDKMVYIIRDPRDTAITTAKYAFIPYMTKNHPTGHPTVGDYLEGELSGICKNWTNHVLGYLESDMKLHYVFYERLLFDFDNEFDSILGYLEMTLPVARKKAMEKTVALHMLKHANPNQQKPKLYGWKHSLTSKQKALCLDIAKPLLQFLNYPINNEIDSLPGFMSDINPKAINGIKRQLTKKSLNQRVKIMQEAFKR